MSSLASEFCPSLAQTSFWDKFLRKVKLQIEVLHVRDKYLGASENVSQTIVSSPGLSLSFKSPMALISTPVANLLLCG